jgi:hypothetical protein
MSRFRCGSFRTTTGQANLVGNFQPSAPQHPFCHGLRKQCVFSGKAAQPRHKKRPVIQGRSVLTPRVLRKKEIHVISDAIAEVMADGPHTI